MTSDENHPARTGEPAADPSNTSEVEGGTDLEDEPTPASPDSPESLESPETPEGPDSAGDSRRRMVLGLSVLAGALVVILVLALTSGRGDSPSAGSSSTTEAPRTTAPTLPQEAMTTFRDDVTGFSMQYPTSWQRAQTPVSELRLVVTPGQGEAVSVRVNPTEQATTPENLGNLKTVTDGIVGSNPDSKILRQATVTLNGLIGYWYLYTFHDQASNLDGVHVHYFLFKGHNMYSIVFQVIPTEDFSMFEGVFDQMTQSFKVETPAPAAASTAPPASPPPPTAAG